MQRMMLTYAQTVGEAALDDTDNAAEVPTELDQLCKTLIRYAPEKKPRKKRMLRPAALAAAVLAVLLAGMIAVQAAGANLFGVRARWNDDILILSKRMPKRRRCTRQRTAAPSFSCVIRTGGQARGVTEATPLHFGALKQESS